jgi:hypothetical protein
MKIKILFPLLFCSITAAAQGVDCNQETWMPSDAKKILVEMYLGFNILLKNLMENTQKGKILII